MKRYYEMSTNERIEDSDRIAIMQIENELRGKKKKKNFTLKFEDKPWRGWKWMKKLLLKYKRS